MSFTSPIFLLVFFPAAVIGYHLIRSELRNLFLLVMSLLFYAWGDTKLVLLLTASILANYLFALRMEMGRGQKSAKVYVVFMLLWNFGILFFFKYLTFTLTNVNTVLGTSFSIPKTTLPLGISFFTFRAVSYCLDVYRGSSAAQINPINAALYISFFPQIAMGPITRYSEFEAQLRDRRVSIDSISEGIGQIIIGLAKKVMIADSLGMMVKDVFAMSSSSRTAAAAWLAAVGYTLQILYDFSGYTDMAAGISQMFGFQFCKNFDRPYTSKSLSEFWRRWHISLGTWFRDYVYIPLGGSKSQSRCRRIWNLFVVWALTGLWHGAAWNFILWGIWNFVVIAFEKLTNIPRRLQRPLGRRAYQAFTMLSVLFGWVIFRANDLKNAVEYIGSMFGLTGNRIFTSADSYLVRSNWVILLAAAVCCIPVSAYVPEKLRGGGPSITRDVVIAICYAVLFIYGIAYMMGGTYEAFIYFKF